MKHYYVLPAFWTLGLCLAAILSAAIGLSHLASLDQKAALTERAARGTVAGARPQAGDVSFELAAAPPPVADPEPGPALPDGSMPRIPESVVASTGTGGPPADLSEPPFAAPPLPDLAADLARPQPQIGTAPEMMAAFPPPAVPLSDPAATVVAVPEAAVAPPSSNGELTVAVARPIDDTDGLVVAVPDATLVLPVPEPAPALLAARDVADPTELLVSVPEAMLALPAPEPVQTAAVEPPALATAGREIADPDTLVVAVPETTVSLPAVAPAAVALAVSAPDASVVLPAARPAPQPAPKASGPAVAAVAPAELAVADRAPPPVRAVKSVPATAPKSPPVARPRPPAAAEPATPSASRESAPARPAKIVRQARRAPKPTPEPAADPLDLARVASGISASPRLGRPPQRFDYRADAVSLPPSLRPTLQP